MSARPQRIQLRRTAGWRKPDGAVVVSRPSIWGNPWKPGQPGRFWLPHYPTADPIIGEPLSDAGVAELYRRLVTHGQLGRPNDFLPVECSAEGRRQVRNWLRDHAARIRSRLPELAGRDLACWCPLDRPCHADVLLDLANRGPG